MRNVLLVLLFLAASVQAEDRLTVYTVNYPLQYFAERIAGERAEVVFPVPAGKDPAFWTPPRDVLDAYQNADLVLLNGASYAKWVDKVSLPQARTVNTSKAFRELFIQAGEVATHGHGPGGDHVHGGMAFTTWLDFDQAAQQAAAIFKALAKKRPVYQAEFESRYKALRSELMQLDLEIQKLLAKGTGTAKPLLASHPVYQYLARRYQLQVKSVSWEPDTAPDESQWQELALVQATYPALWMLWERQPVAETLQRLGALNIQAVVYDPCANRPPQGDFISVMRANVDRLGTVFR